MKQAKQRKFLKYTAPLELFLEFRIEIRIRVVSNRVPLFALRSKLIRKPCSTMIQQQQSFMAVICLRVVEGRNGGKVCDVISPSGALTGLALSPYCSVFKVCFDEILQTAAFQWLHQETLLLRHDVGPRPK